MKKQNERRQFLKLTGGIGTGILLGISGVPVKAQDPLSAEEFFQVIKKRRSIRKFKPVPIPGKHLMKILDAARLAPTAGNQQPWKFLVVQDKAKIEELKNECVSRSIENFKKNKKSTEDELNAQKKKVINYFNGLLSAPAFVVVLTDNKSKYPGYNDKDGPLAAGYLMLAARALGYGTLFITDSISEETTRKVFKIPDQYKRVCFIPIGVPENWPESPGKKKLDDFIIKNSF